MNVPGSGWMRPAERAALIFPAREFCLTGLLFLFFPGSAAGIIADRIMAVVNKEVIALSDVQEYGALFPGEGGMDQKAVLDRLIDQTVLLAEAKKLEIPPPAEEEIVFAYQDLESRHGGPAVFQSVRERMNLSEEEIRHYLRARLHIERLIEQRIRFFVFATPREVEAFREEFPDRYSDLPEDEALAAIQASIIEKKAGQKLATYLDRLRTRTDIQINYPRQ